MAAQSHFRETNTSPSLPIVFEDGDILVINKPAGVLSQADHTGDPDVYNLCLQYLSQNTNKEPYLGLLHRLDRPVSGLMILAKNRDSASEISRQIHDNTIQKSYQALVYGKPPVNGVLVHYLEKEEEQNMVYVVDQSRQHARRAELAYQRIKTNDQLSLLNIHLQTGRPHQIRVQLAEEGYPVWGDHKYGRTSSVNEDQEIALLARQITLIHPKSRQELNLTADVPDRPPWSQFPET